MATFRSLAKRLDKFADNLPKKINKLAQQTANDVLTIVTSPGVTRVDTSEAVSNWRIGLGVKDPSTRAPFFKGKKTANGGSTTGAASRAEVRLVGKIKIAQKQPGQEIHISNSVDYLDVAFDGDVNGIIALAEVQLQDRIQRLKL